MPGISAYHRPPSLAEAAALLAAANTQPLAGGTLVVPASRAGLADVELVDLQALGLGAIETSGDRLRLGAMARLGDLVADERVPALLRSLAQRELPSVLRDAATVGGTIAAAEADSVLLAGLLVHDAVVEFHDAADAPLADVLAAGVGDRLIIGVTVASGGSGTIEATGRTPADVPIVAAVGRATDSGVLVALTGVAATPVLVDVADPTAGLEPPADFRGSADYRRHLAQTLTARIREDLA